MKKIVNLHTHNKNILNAEDKFGLNRERNSAPKNISQLGEVATELLNKKNLEVSMVRPFFWSLVETYVDRFHVYPFDVSKALLSYLEFNDFPEEKLRELVKQVESQFEQTHGRPLRKPAQIIYQQENLDDEIIALRSSLKYAAMVAENSGQEK